MLLLPLWLQAQPTAYSVDALILDAATRAPVAGARIRISAGAFTRITGASGARATIAIPLLAHAVISGRVIDPEGIPLQGYKIELLTDRRPGDTQHEGDATRA
jgi:hypothetical protein